MTAILLPLADFTFEPILLSKKIGAGCFNAADAGTQLLFLFALRDQPTSRRIGRDNFREKVIVAISVKQQGSLAPIREEPDPAASSTKRRWVCHLRCAS